MVTKESSRHGRKVPGSYDVMSVIRSQRKPVPVHERALIHAKMFYD